MKLINLKQGSQEWLDYRKDKIGSSDVSKILGVSRWGTARELWEEKMGLRGPKSMNASMQRGHDLEPYLRELFENEHDINVYPIVAEHDEYPFMAASFDGYCLETNTVVEIKTNNRENHAKAIKGTLCDDHYAQVQYQMFIAGISAMYYLSYGPDGDYIIIKIARDEAHIEKMKAAVIEFNQLLIDMTAPERTEKDSPIVQVKKGSAWESAVAEFLSADLESKIAKERLDIAKDKLIELAEGKECAGAGIELKLIEMKGRINYDAIEELKSIDMEQYRSAPTQYWKVTKGK